MLITAIICSHNKVKHKKNAFLYLRKYSDIRVLDSSVIFTGKNLLNRKKRIAVEKGASVNSKIDIPVRAP